MDPIRPEFELLDSTGLEYRHWAADVETTYATKDHTATIKPSTVANVVPATEKENANALMFLKRHIDPNLRWGYHHFKTPKELWDALESRFGNIHDSLFPQLQVQWNEIRFLDYVKVNDFQKGMLQLQARLNFCGTKLTDGEMIQKTLSTFLTSLIILANQYQLDVDNKRITNFSKLINLIQVAERQNEILVNNNARVVGNKKVHEANYDKVNIGKNPKGKRGGHADQSHSHDSYSHTPYTCGRGHGRGGNSNVWNRDVLSGPNGGSSMVEKAPRNPPIKRDEVGNGPCYRCGSVEHWYQQCKASNKVAYIYKKYRESIEQEAHYMDENENPP
ncbi:uncharacterized protein LOC113311229 [Papaver somniferum]|uniref:uncharacterized protein LOC113311229 n=1 Tax=Papaver somniferum TaxID=3469 RepID=UPI000E6FB9BF|nr:uncharacterized protein LOC113311229 [Papaver somniferum]